MADLDGVVRIGTEIDDSGFKQGMKNLGKTAEKELNSTEQEFKKTEKNLDKLGNAANDAKKDISKFADELDDAEKEAKNLSSGLDKAGNGLSSFTSFLGAGLLTSGITSLISGFSNAVAESEEFTKSLSRLEINAQTAGNSFDNIQDQFTNFIALTGQADSSAEALSNLLQTGFDDAGITQAVEALSGAVVQFPDTLNIESLADGLQETLATGTATGQFGELLDRLGIGAENFSTQLAGVTTEAEKQQLVLQTLADAGLNDVYQQYEQANAATLEFKEAQAELDIAMSNFVVGTLPMVSEGFGQFSDGILALSEAYKEGGITGVIDLIKQSISGLPEAISAAMPQIIESGTNAIISFVEGAQQSIPEILDTGVEIINSLVNGILQALPQMVSKLPQIITTFVQFITSSLPQIINAGIDILLNLLNGIIQTIPKLVAQLPQIITSITSTLATNLPQIIQAGFNLLLKLADGIISAIPSLVSKLPQIISAIVNGLIALVGGIIDVGKSIVEGLWQGILGAKDWLIGKVKGFGQDILDGLKGFFGIHSPSTVMRDVVGKNLVLGIVEGVNAYGEKVVIAITKPVEEAAKKVKNIGLAKNMTDVISQAIEKSKTEAKSYSDVGDILTEALQTSIDDNKEETIEKIQSLIDESLEAIKDDDEKAKAKEAADDLMKTYQEALEAGASKAKQYVSESISSITEEFQNQYDDLISKQQALEENLGGEYLFEVQDGEVFIEDLENSIDVLERYQEALTSLQEKGASQDLIDQIGTYDPEEGLAIMENLLSMSDDDFTEFQENWAEKKELARQIAEEAYSDQLTELKESFIDEMIATLEKVPDDTFDIGVDSMQGWIDGMNNKLPDLEAKAREIARSVISAMKSEMGIESPSKEGEYIGEMMNAGVAKGLDNSVDIVDKSIAKLGFFDAVKASIPQMQSAVMSAMSAMVPAPVYSMGGNTSNVNNYSNPFNLYVDKIVNSGSGTTEQFFEDAAFYTKVHSRQKGGK